MKSFYIGAGLLLLLVIISLYMLYPAETSGGNSCVVDSDCVLFGSTGDCNCGCYVKGYPWVAEEGVCYCAAPQSCECVNGLCAGVFAANDGEIDSFEECVNAGYPVMESYPPQCAVPGGQTFVEDSCQYEFNGENIVLTISLAREAAINSECGDRLKGTYICNEVTGTYWLDLDIEQEGCSPACVVDVPTREAEINYRCTGLVE